SRRQLEQHKSLVQDAIIRTAQDQDFESLRTLAGKLYFKEAVVNAINTSLRSPIIRDVHLASFALQ
ncbi:flagellar basal body-associated FliL family protein, partial [bacterium]|nr:flagellar basal body-associated FliL family protein [bacterium]